MTIWSDLRGVEEQNKKHLSGLTFVCPTCRKSFKFEELTLGIVSSGYDYLCPEDGAFIMLAEEIQDRKFPNLRSEVLRRERMGDQYVPRIWVWGE